MNINNDTVMLAYNTVVLYRCWRRANLAPKGFDGEISPSICHRTIEWNDNIAIIKTAILNVSEDVERQRRICLSVIIIV